MLKKVHYALTARMKSTQYENATDFNVAIHVEKQIIDGIPAQIFDATGTIRWVIQLLSA